MNDLPGIFTDFSEARQQGFLKVKELKEQGRKVVGTFCAFTPWEIIAAAGAVPVSLCGMEEEPIADAEKHLPRNLCPLIKSSYGFAVSEKCPYFYFSDFLVGETTCDGKKKMYEFLSEMKPMHVMQLPQTSQGEQAFSAWRQEMDKLKERLEREFGVTITEEKLRQAIVLRNRERKALREFYELGTLCPPAVPGVEILKVIYGSGFKLDKQEQIATLQAMTLELKEKYRQGHRPVAANAPRILITGCPLGGATEKVVKIIEESGGVVVAFENCSGIKGNDRLVDETSDPMDALTEKYLNTACSCMSPNDNRIELLGRLIEQYQVDGVVDVILQACHTYNVESFRIKRYINEQRKLPYMALETDYSQSDLGQLRTRLAAFIEML